MWTITLSGTKDETKAQVETQVLNPNDKAYLKALIDHAPGTHVSLSGSMTEAEDSSFGSISLSGSFWSPMKKT